MTIEQAENLIPDQSFVEVAGGKYLFSGIATIAGGVKMIEIYDEPPSKHVDLWNLESVKSIK